jgi:hypothetical protein
MDIEEIKCSLCSQIYNGAERMPILLPDCGHSFCFTCITQCFEIITTQNEEAQQQNKLDEINVEDVDQD